jgi:tetratricopeptide (TPR) repeat protein
VMLAPGVFYLILSGDRKALLDGKRFVVLSLFFVLPLLVYLYLPVRTWAGVAIHWGDPDSWDRFWAHVSGRSHRGGYVFNLGVWGYVERLKESLGFIWDQFGVMVLVGVWGWWRIRLVRWRVFFVGVVGFDLFYTVFLNTISLEITPFNLSVCVVLAVGIGSGIADLVRRCEPRVSGGVMRGVRLACGVVPVMFLVLNFGVSDQSRNYTAYEHALNIFRTTGPGDAVLADGDNHFFPLVYGRVVERMREDTALYDRLNLIFKLIPALNISDLSPGDWLKARAEKETAILEHARGTNVFFAVFDPGSILISPSYRVTAYCLLHRAMKKEDADKPYRLSNLWRYYATESLYAPFTRDFMNRQIHAHFRLRYGQFLFAGGDQNGGRQSVQEAAKIAPDDFGVHMAAASILMNEDLLEQAREELDRASSFFPGGSAILDNNWGCYFFRRKDYDTAVGFFRKAAETSPATALYHRNLALALRSAGRYEEAAKALDAFSGTHPYPGGNQDLVAEQPQEAGIR